MCLYPAQSLFLDGYLNGQCGKRRRTYEMIRDAGFEIVSDQPLDDLMDEIAAVVNPNTRAAITVGGQPALKSIDELRPARVDA